jgi:hypothetical protein
VKLGKIANDVLDQYCKQDWQKTNIHGRDEVSLVATIVLEPNDSVFHSLAQESYVAIFILLNAGLNILAKTAIYPSTIDLDFKSENIIRITCSQTNNLPRPVNFINDLKKAINEYVNQLPLFCTERPLSSENRRYIATSYLFRPKNQWVIMQHTPLYNSERLLAKLAEDHNCEDIQVISASDCKLRGIAKYFIVGNRQLVTEFIAKIPENLSVTGGKTITAPAINKLQDQCLNAILRFSLFCPESFSFENLTKLGFPDEIGRQIQAKTMQMEVIKNAQALEKYQGKIVIFKSSYHCLVSNRGWSMYTEQPELKVAVVGKNPISADAGIAYALNMLLLPSEANTMCFLFTPTLQYANFEIRLASFEELEKIKLQVQAKKLRFNYLDFVNPVVQMLEEQKLDIEKIAFRKK